MYTADEINNLQIDMTKLSLFAILLKRLKSLHTDFNNFECAETINRIVA
jgi:hypothetical protein